MKAPSYPVTVDPGGLRNQIALLNAATTADSVGDLAPATVFAQCWASIATMTGQELYRASQFTSEANHLVVIRYLPGVLPSMRVQFGSRRFEILYIDNVQERNIRLDLFCKEILS